jgi:signal peptidase I
MGIRRLEASLKKNSPIILKVRGNSMSPLMEEGDRAVAIPVNLEKISEGDIVLCQINDEMVVHRVISLYRENGKDKVLTKGDANKKADSFSQKIFAKIVAIKKDGGWVFVDSEWWNLLNKMIAFCSSKNGNKIFNLVLRVTVKISAGFVKIRKIQDIFLQGAKKYREDKKIDKNSYITQKRQVFLRNIDRNNLILTADSPFIYTLNPTGAKIYSAIEKRIRIREVIAETIEDIKGKEGDIIEFLKELKKHGLIEVEEKDG